VNQSINLEEIEQVEQIELVVDEMRSRKSPTLPFDATSTVPAIQPMPQYAYPWPYPSSTHWTFHPQFGWYLYAAQ
jgi:hypothetical protein